MKKKTVIVILNCLIILLLGVSCSFGQEKVASLKDKKITLQLENKSLELFFLYLTQKYDVPIGLEGSTLDNDHVDYVFTTNLWSLNPDMNNLMEATYIAEKHPITINAKDARLEEVLNQIVGQMKNYKWEINDDVVNIIPTKGRDERYEKLLGLHIDNFTFEKNEVVGLIRKSIFNLPEVKAFLDENKILFSNQRPLARRGQLRRLPDEMNFSNLTFRELLNKITKVKRGGWYLRKNFLFGNAEEEYIEIDI